MALTDRLMAGVSATLALLSGTLLAAILAVMVADVARRNATGRSIAGAYEVITIMLVGVVFLGLAHAERTDSTIKLTLLTSRLPAPAALSLRLLSGGVSLATCAWLAVATVEAAQRSVERGELQQGLLSIPIWPAKVVIAAGFSVLAIELALSLRRTWLRSRAPASREPAPGDPTPGDPVRATDHGAGGRNTPPLERNEPRRES